MSRVRLWSILAGAVFAISCAGARLGGAGTAAPAAALACGAPPTGYAKPWTVSAQRQSYDAAVSQCVQDWSDERASSWLRSMSFPRVDTASGVIRTDKVSLALPMRCALGYEEIVSAASMLRAVAASRCARERIAMQCSGERSSAAAPAPDPNALVKAFQTLAGQLTQQAAGISAAATDVGARSLCETVERAALELRHLRTEPLPEESLADGHVSESNTHGELVNAFGATAHRSSVDVDMLRERLSRLEEQAGVRDQLLQSLLSSRAPACVANLRVEADRVRKARADTMVLLGGLDAPMTVSNDLLRPMTVDLVLRASFAPCKADLTDDVRSKLTSLGASLLRTLAPKSKRESDGTVVVQITGYADQQPLLDEFVCLPFSSNYDLAEGRARAVEQELRKAIPNTNRVATRAIGEDRVFVRDCNWLAAEQAAACHEENRRIAIQLRFDSLAIRIPSECQADASGP